MNTKKNHRKQTKIKSRKLITKKNSKKKYLRQIGGSLSPEEKLKKLKIELIKRNELIKYIKKRLNEEEIQKETQVYTLIKSNQEDKLGLSYLYGKKNKSLPGIEGIFIMQVDPNSLAEESSIPVFSQIIKFNDVSCINMTEFEMYRFFKQNNDKLEVKIKCTEKVLNLYDMEISKGSNIQEKITFEFNEDDGLYIKNTQGNDGSGQVYGNIIPDNSIVILIICEYKFGGEPKEITFYNYQNIDFVQTKINYLSKIDSVTLKILCKIITHHFC